MAGRIPSVEKLEKMIQALQEEVRKNEIKRKAANLEKKYSDAVIFRIRKEAAEERLKELRGKLVLAKAEEALKKKGKN